MFRSFLDHHQGAMFLLAKVILYSHLTRFCKHGVVATCHVVWEYAVKSAAG